MRGRIWKSIVLCNSYWIFRDKKLKQYTSKEKVITGINVCNEGGAIEVGDLLVSSSKSNFFKKQSDDLLRNYTAARSMQNITFDSNGEAKEVYCIMTCG